MYFCDEHRGITRYYEILKSSVCEKYQLRQMEYDILMFLYNNPQHSTAADIVRYRKSTKSHVSMSLKVLEEKGLIERRIDKDNKKRVEIYILDSADDIIKDGIRVQKQFAKDMFNGLTDDEIALCKQIFKKICNNAEACIKAANKKVPAVNKTAGTLFFKEDINYSTSCNAAKFSSPVRTFTTRSTLYTKILPSPI